MSLLRTRIEIKLDQRVHDRHMNVDVGSRIERIDETTFAWDVPEGWLQGRGAWGGLVVAAQVKAVEQSQAKQDAQRRIRNMTTQLFGALPIGRARLSVECLRQGSAMTTWQVRVHGHEGQLASQAVVITGGSRPVEPGSRWGIATMPTLPPWTEVPTVPVEPPYGPSFGAHFAFRPVSGIPGSGESPQCLGWIGPADSERWDHWSAATMLGIVDAWWPATYVSEESLAHVRPMATVSFAAHLLVDPATVDPNAPLAVETWVADAEDGFTSETRRLWTPDGRLAVENHQAIVVIK